MFVPAPQPQPPPPPPVFMGGAQPFAAHAIAAAIPATSMRPPGVNPGARALSVVLAAWHPRVKPGGFDQYVPQGFGRRLPPSLLAVRVDAPPPRPPIALREQLAWQIPPPAPILAGKLAPAVTAVAVNNPPFASRNALREVLAWHPRVEPGGFGQYVPRWLNPFFAAVPVDAPPRASPGALREVLAWQIPTPTPILAGKLAPALSAVAVNDPPFAARSVMGEVLAWQPPPPAPFVPRWLNPIFAAVAVDAPPRAAPGALREVLAWHPRVEPGGFGQYVPRWLNPALEASRVDAPPPAARGAIREQLAWQTPAPAPILGAKLSPAIAAQRADNPPFARPDRLNAVLAWQSPASAPWIPRLLSSALIGVPVDSPPFAGPVVARLAATLAAWQPPPPAPWTPRDLSPDAEAVEVDAPPVAGAPVARLAATLVAWRPAPPMPWVPRNLSPAFEAVRVDQPPVRQVRPGRDPAWDWQPRPPLPTAPDGQPDGRRISAASIPRVLGLGASAIAMPAAIRPAMLNPLQRPPAGPTVNAAIIGASTLALPLAARVTPGGLGPAPPGLTRGLWRPSRSRTLRLPDYADALALAWPNHAAGETLDYSIDFGEQFAPGATASVLIAGAGLALQSLIVAGSFATLWLTGGAAATQYAVALTVTDGLRVWKLNIGLWCDG